MISIRDFIQQIIYIAAVAIIIELILPKGNTKKYVYVILSLFILLNIVSPVINIIRDIDMQTVYEDILANISSDTTQNTDDAVEVFSEYKNEKVIETLKIELINEIEEKLSNMNVELKDLDIEINDKYEFQDLEITISNLGYLGEQRDKKILDVMLMLEDDYDIKNNVITIIEEGE